MTSLASGRGPVPVPGQAEHRLPIRRGEQGPPADAVAGRWYPSKDAYNAAVQAPARYPTPSHVLALLSRAPGWMTVLACGLRIDGEVLSVDFLPAGLAGFARQPGNLVAGLLHRPSPVYLLATGITRDTARKLSASKPAPNSQDDLRHALDVLCRSRPDPDLRSQHFTW